MSELVQTRRAQHLKRQLLATASALTLMGFVNGAQASDDSASDHPLVWIELGGQFDHEIDPSQTWTPPNVPPPLVQPTFQPFGRMPGIGYDWDGKVSIQPDDSSWIFSAAIQFGKAKHGPKSTHDQDEPTGLNLFSSLPAPPTYAFTNTHSSSDTGHLILDFQAGKDFGLGLFGGHGSSNINFGIRVAQFTQNASGVMTAQVSAVHKYNGGVVHEGDIHAARSFNGLGPSIDWKASVPLTGSLANGVTFDWGANGAVLFGRQKADVRLHTKEVRYGTGFSTTPPPLSTVLAHTSPVLIRKRQVIVPNIGGFAGVSLNFPRAKLSLGYRADFFFGAIDGGIDAAHKENVGFYGPFASVSIGIGG
jgi:hypothetical protein